MPELQFFTVLARQKSKPVQIEKSAGDLELFFLKHFCAALVTAFGETVVATVLANRVGASSSSATIAVVSLNRLESEMRAADALSVSRLTAFGVGHS
jgi:hypothetical protein